ncbi:anticodon-binding domain-containing protein [Aspergillus mulundensis]|uniref:AD domain-containing protein n=1 Tax=Aspergillus mulundensis TaxID=1810919 RepID=A0A3D8T575_9EURO|nr:Uncharacterized protein DSM5745_01039 [Aspergillus mulundensis]RDW93717.1 Uncharacterized protein DSM5745_01039 [Aspergillus mulundensis]
MAGAIVPHEQALSDVLGARVRITTNPASSTIEGTVFAADPITNLVAVNTADGKQTQAGNYHVIPISRIQSFELLSLPQSAQSGEATSFADAVPPLHALDTQALRRREVEAVTKLQQGEARRGKGVTQEAQDLFNAFIRTMPTTRWDGANIIVADAVVVAPPYRADDCRALHAGDTAALARIRKVLEMERQKIEFRNASAAIGAANTFSRSAASGPGAAGPRKGG